MILGRHWLLKRNYMDRLLYSLAIKKIFHEKFLISNEFYEMSCINIYIFDLTLSFSNNLINITKKSFNQNRREKNTLQL